MSQTKLNILLLNHVWLREELIALGCNVITAGWQDNGYDIRFPWRCSTNVFLSLLPSDAAVDCLVYYDDSGLPCILDFENIPFRKIFYSVDTHHHVDWHLEFAKLFDVTLVAQKNFLSDFSNISANNKVSWFPPWATRYIEPTGIRDVDVSFRGTMDEGLHPGRKSFFEYCSRFLNIDFGQGDYVDIYARSKIVINEAVRGDLNFRVFESIMAGALLINPRISNGMEDLFIEGIDYIAFDDGDADDAVKYAKYYLENEDQRRLIADSARVKLLSQHSSAHRAAELKRLIMSIFDSNIRASLKTTLTLHSNLLRYFWLFIRKFEQKNMTGYLDDTVSHLEQLIKNNCIDFKSDIKTREVSILIIDSLLNDLLEPESYSSWISSLHSSGSGILIAEQLYEAFSESSNLLDAETKSVLKQLFTENRKNFINGLMLNSD